MSEVRQRNPKKSEPASSVASRVKAEDQGNPFSLFEIGRTIVFLLLCSSALSWFVTRDSIFWNLKRPAYTRAHVIKSWLRGPQQFTEEELKKYDGTDPTLPIYLAINGTIYDVSLGRKFYGPGGSYHFFAGADATRAFVTSCFDTDITPDLRGVEQMYLPEDNEEIDRLYTKAQLKKVKEQERRKAVKEVEKAIKHWMEFFGGSSKYTTVGKVRRVEGWESRGPVPELCKKAREGRPKRKRPVEASL